MNIYTNLYLTNKCYIIYKMFNIKITIQYDGTNFYGWQIQPNLRTIQGEIYKAVEKVYYKKSTIYGCGRTDAGVHALGQVANFKVEKMLVPIERVHIALNSCLPKDIRIIKAELMPDDFNSRASATFREYIYAIYNADISSPFYEKYAWFYRKNIINEELINKYSEYLLGEHNFTSFCSTEDENDSKYRYIERAYAIRKKDFVYFIIRGNAFLHNMVRIIVGTLIEGQRKKEPLDFIKEIIKKENRAEAFITAPPYGLYFRKALFSNIN